MDASDPYHIRERLQHIHDGLEQRGELLSTEQLQAGYAAFRARFGPEALKFLDGPALLNTMHAHGNRESLVYWLEFKNDDEFPGRSFGSISGGGAHKFGLFRRKETNQWVTGSPIRERSISEAEAIDIARRHRDQLLLGIGLLEAVPAEADDDAYLVLQNALEKQAPDICRVAWSHKYWSLLFPEKLDDFHNEQFQRYNLLRLLEIPPAQDGLYTLKEVQELVGISRSAIYLALSEGDLRAVKAGRRTLVLAKDLRTWLEKLPAKS